MRVRRFLAAIAVTASLVVILTPTAAQADGGGRPLSAELSGVNEVPPADPDGAGKAVLRLNPGQQEICYQLQVTDVAPATRSAHSQRSGRRKRARCGSAFGTDRRDVKRLCVSRPGAGSRDSHQSAGLLRQRAQL